MRKPINQMTEREMLMELLQEKRRDEKMMYAKIALVAAIVILLMILGVKYLPPVIDFFRQLKIGVDQLSQTVNDIRSGTDALRESVSGLKDSGAESLQEAADKINELLQRLPAIFR